MNWDIHEITIFIFNGCQAIKYKRTLEGYIENFTYSL